MHATLRCFSHSVYTAVTKCHQHSGPSPSFFRVLRRKVGITVLYGTAGLGFFSQYDLFYAEQPLCSYGFFAKCDLFYAEQPFCFNGFFVQYDLFYAEQPFCSNGFFAKCDLFYAEQPFSFSNGFFAQCSQLLRSLSLLPRLQPQQTNLTMKLTLNLKAAHETLFSEDAPQQSAQSGFSCDVRGAQASPQHPTAGNNLTLRGIPL